MLRAVATSILGRKLRLAMSALAIVLGTAFVAGSLIFTDTLGRAFDDIMDGSVGDVLVMPGEVALQFTATRTAGIGPEVVEDVRAVPGVARAEGNVVVDNAFVVDTEGSVVGGQGAPSLGINFHDAPAAGGRDGMVVVSGRAPGAGEVVLDAATADRSGYALGDEVTIIGPGDPPVVTATLVGTATFGSGGTAGASYVMLDTATAQGFFTEGRNAFHEIWVSAEPGVDQDTLAARIAEVLPDGLNAHTGTEVAEAVRTEVAQAMTFIGTFLLVFAGIALVVGSFLIVNTFSILVAQRSRELALFRALGASRRQVQVSVLIEALVVGLAGSLAGLGIGVLLAMGIRALFAQIGLDLSGTSLVFGPQTVAITIALGMVVTAAAALLPARRASRIAPVAALSDDVAMPEGALHRRLVVGVAMAGLGAVLVALALATELPQTMPMLGGGILLVLLGVAVTSPVLGRPVLDLLGVGYRAAYGSIGELARQNSVRNPRRTAATASALMIGLTLVSAMAVLGSSAKASFDEIVADAMRSDYVVQNPVGMTFSPSIGDRIEQVDGVAEVARVRFAPGEVDGEPAFLVGISPERPDAVIEVTPVAGELAAFGPGTVLVDADVAMDRGMAVGDELAVSSHGELVRLRVAALVEYAPGTGAAYTMDLQTLADFGWPPSDGMLGVTRAEGADASAVHAALREAVADVPLVAVSDQAEFVEQQTGFVDQFLALIYALLALAVVIAALGIVNTLGLSVIERTREIGLLRAIGLRRSQLRRMVRLESVAIALLGAVLGVGLGLAFGTVLQRALVDEGLVLLAIPWGQVAIFLVLAALVGVLAALWPAHRASRMNVLQAIATQ